MLAFKKNTQTVTNPIIKAPPPSAEVLKAREHIFDDSNKENKQGTDAAAPRESSINSPSGRLETVEDKIAAFFDSPALPDPSSKKLVTACDNEEKLVDSPAPLSQVADDTDTDTDAVKQQLDFAGIPSEDSDDVFNEPLPYEKDPDLEDTAVNTSADSSELCVGNSDDSIPLPGSPLMSEQKQPQEEGSTLILDIQPDLSLVSSPSGAILSLADVVQQEGKEVDLQEEAGLRIPVAPLASPSPVSRGVHDLSAAFGLNFLDVPPSLPSGSLLPSSSVMSQFNNSAESLAFDRSDDIDTKAQKRIKQLYSVEKAQQIIDAIAEIDSECKNLLVSTVIGKKKLAEAIQAKVAGFKVALANDRYGEIKAGDEDTRTSFIQTLALSYKELCVALGRYDSFQKSTILSQQEYVSGSTKLLACLGILVAALSGAFLGATLGSVAGPGGTVVGAIKGAIHAGGLAAKLTLGGSGAAGVLTAGGLGYCLRHTLFPPAIQVTIPPDPRVKTILEKGNTLVGTTDTEFPILKRP